MTRFFIPVLILLFTLTYHSVSWAQKTINFPSKDGLQITSDLYIVNENETTPFIVLFHQASWSRGEYLEIAPKLNKLGFNCMAVDLRSGKSVNNIQNETSKKAINLGMRTTYVDALVDIEAALTFSRMNYAKEKLIAWGSSYSAALVLKVAGSDQNIVDGVLAFAPGEYFAKFGKSSTWIQEYAKNITVPVFITSAKKEKQKWTPIFDSIQNKDKASYIPITSGNHGSRALWDKFDDSQGYWDAVIAFLINYFPRK